MKKDPIFRYSHKDKLSFTFKQKFIITILIIFSIFFYLIFFPVMIAFLILTLIYTLIVFPKRNIYLTSRYLICGNTIFYYQNINKISLNSNSGTLHIYSDGKEIFKLEKELFPTNARKTDKIANNKNNKFKKVSDKIINKIMESSPDVEIHGVSR